MSITYKLVASDDISRFGDTVQRLLYEGWELQGGISVVVWYYDGSVPVFHYTQAVIKTNELGDAKSND